jgi:hypothetical protein
LLARGNREVALRTHSARTGECRARFEGNGNPGEHRFDFVLESATATLSGDRSPATKLVTFHDDVVDRPLARDLVVDEIGNADLYESSRHLIRLPLGEASESRPSSPFAN